MRWNDVTIDGGRVILQLVNISVALNIATKKTLQECCKIIAWIIQIN